MHEFHILVLNFNVTKPAFHSCSRGSLPSRAHVKLTAEMETMRAWPFFSSAASLLWFFNRNQVGKPIYQGFPSSNRDVKPGRKTRGVAALVTHIKQTFLWAGCLESSRSWDSGEWRGTLLFKKMKGEKKRNPTIEGYLSGKQTSG